MTATGDLIDPDLPHIPLGDLADLLRGWIVAVPSWVPAIVVGTVVAVVAVAPLRRFVGRRVRSIRVHWRWSRRAGGLRLVADGDERAPSIVKVTHDAVGERVLLQLPVGGSVSRLEARAGAVAAAMEVAEVRIEPNRSNARYPTVVLVRRDPLAEHGPLDWPWRDRARTSLWDRVPVAVDANGATVDVGLGERNLLLGGEPGAGKSAALSPLVAAAALDPTVRLHTLDGKLVELAPWKQVADHAVGVDLDDAIALVEHLRSVMDDRYRDLLAHRRRKVGPDDGLPLHVVVCDELAHYITNGNRNQTKAFAEGMRDLVSRGRAAGVIVLAATQKPSADVIPTALRDLFGFRWAMRCSTPQASDTVLGQGWASQGCSAADIDSGLRGVGWLLVEGGTPRRCKSFYLRDDDLWTIADRATALRRTTATTAV